MTILVDIWCWANSHTTECLRQDRCVCGAYDRQNADFEQRLKQAMERYPEQFNQPKERALKRHIGTKVIMARPVTRGEYNSYRGWAPPDGEDQSVLGYLVEYTDGGTPNHPDHAGYISWSPKEQFDNAYRETTGMSFGLAVEAMKKGERVARATWPLGVFVYHVPAASYPVQTGAAKAHFGEGSMVPYMAYLAIKRADDQVCVFAPGMDSILADDWQIVE